MVFTLQKVMVLIKETRLIVLTEFTFGSFRMTDVRFIKVVKVKGKDL